MAWKTGKLPKAAFAWKPYEVGHNIQIWTDQAHALECDTSCNRCLRDYYSLAYHGLLDWRLALDMARLAFDPAAVVDLTSPWTGLDNNPWERLCADNNGPIHSTLVSLGYQGPKRLADLIGYGHVSQNWVKIIRHPLWTDNHPIYQKARAEAARQFPDHGISAINPFEAIRRPSDALIYNP